MPVTDLEARLIEATKRFANAETITSTEWVEALFRRAGRAPRFRIIEPEQVRAYRDDRETLRGWLTAIAEGRGASVATQVASWVGTLDAALTFDARRREIVTVYMVGGVRAACGLACAFLLSRSRKLTTRVNVCHLPNCSSFVVDLTVHRGAAEQYCSPAHRSRGWRIKATERMRRARRDEQAEKRERTGRR
jgi:hypothetical protein